MQHPDYHHHDEFKTRLAKLDELRAIGVDPYPHTYTPTHTAEHVATTYHDEPVGHSPDAEAHKTPFVCVAGRLMLFRAMGKNAFGQIQDMGHNLQFMVSREHTKLTGFTATEELTAAKVIEKKVDLGDIVGIKGYLFRTQKNELTVLVTEFTLLSKALLPLPDKHSGLVDKELRYRKRWLDLIDHKDVLRTFVLRSRIVSIVRAFHAEHNFLEVETPILQNIYGGAAARPFTSHLNALDKEMYLRIALEISLKKLLVGGMKRVFEIGKIFRNEGIDRTHNPEFTMIESYAAYWDYSDVMSFCERLLERIALELYQTTIIPIAPMEGAEPVNVDFKAPWARMTMAEAILKWTHIDVATATEDEMRAKVASLGTVDPKEIKKANRGLLTQLLFEEFCEQHLIQPTHITDHPIETTPLCKPHRDAKLRERGFVERFESFVLGRELCNAYTELNDPVVQRKLLVDQNAAREAGDDEAHPLDEEFIEAVCQGMPPAGGIGIGIDRLVMLFTQQPSIRDVLFFPIMRS